MGGGSGPRAAPGWTQGGSLAGGTGGGGGVGLGDWNGDGGADFAVSSPDGSGRSANEGRGYVYLGARKGPPRKSSWTAEGFGTTASYGNGSRPSM